MTDTRLLDEFAAAAVARADGRLVVLIDGRSGAGKTTLASSLARHLAGLLGCHVQLVSLDDCYPGWGGLAAGSAAVPEMLSPDPGYSRYDWAAGCTAEWVPLDAGAPIVIEGSGALTPASAELASLRVWLDAPEAIRRQAVEDREGSTEDWWELWADQEEAHIAANNPEGLADVSIQLF